MPYPSQGSQGLSETEVDAKVASHAGNSSAHHTATDAMTSKVTNSSRDRTAASGDVSYTGIGFLPTCLLAMASIDGQNDGSWGFAGAGLFERRMITYGANPYFTNGSEIIRHQSGSAGQYAVLKTFDADGFTLTWTKFATPAAGTVLLNFLSLK